MHAEAIQEIRACLPRGRTLFHDARDRYALLLLGYAAEHYGTIAALRRSPYAQLLEKPAVKRILAAQGNGRVSPDLFRYAPEKDWQTYTLTLSQWPKASKGRPNAWDQVSRAGQNLVLQLNFSNEHDAAYRRLNGTRSAGAFAYTCHPVKHGGRYTLAWARLDIDLEGGEALVEELQTDWIRDIHEALEDYRRYGKSDTGWKMVQKWYGISCSREQFKAYTDEVLAHYKRQWHDSMLSAVIFFLREELGIRRIFYHTPESHKALKRMGNDLPPRSLYTKLPRRFCFRETEAVPAFLPDRYVRRAQARCAFRLQLLEL
jgi:hypothetical protein